MKNLNYALGLAALSMVIFAYLLWTNAGYVNDDAYITLRYAHHLMEGKGLVWNPGEPVEGYTSFLTTVLIALLGKLGCGLLFSARLINFCSFVILTWYLICFFKRQNARQANNALALVLPTVFSLCSLSFAVWIWGGLEAPFFALGTAICAGTFLGLREDNSSGTFKYWLTGLGLGSLPLIRPDGLIFIFITFGFAAYLAYQARRQGQGNWQRWIHFNWAMFILPALHIGGRLWFYGELMPNTVSVKAVDIPPGLIFAGTDYFIQWCLRPPFLPLVAILGAGLAWFKGAKRLPILYLSLCVIAYGLMVIRVGGEFMPRHRLLIPLLPLCGILSFYGFVHYLKKAGAAKKYLIIILTSALLATQMLVPSHKVDPAAFLGTIVGKHIKYSWPPGSVIALNTAGSTPYFAPDFVYIDMLGLNNRYIAKRRGSKKRLGAQFWPGHAKGDGQYVLNQQPDYIIIGSAEGIPLKRISLDPDKLLHSRNALFLSDLELLENPEFHRQYIEQTEDINVEQVPNRFAYFQTRDGILSFTYFKRRDAQP